MSTAQFIQKYKSLPEHLKRELLLFLEFLIQREQLGGKQEDSPMAKLNLPDFDKPIGLSAYAISQENLSDLKELWKDEPDAEELCKLLTP